MLTAGVGPGVDACGVDMLFGNRRVCRGRIGGRIGGRITVGENFRSCARLTRVIQEDFLSVSNRVDTPKGCVMGAFFDREIE